MFYNATSNSILWPLFLIFLAAEIVAIAVSTLVGIVIANYLFKRFKYELLDSGFRKELSFIWKRDATIPYERIHSVDITRGIWARILGLSELHIQTAKMRFDNATDYGTDFKEHLIIGIAKQEAERLREELIKRARGSKNQGV
jgi:membrane protein YdbS with pleckstrin-like domain